MLTPREGPDFVAALPVGRFHGVGPVTAERMKRLGIFTGMDLRQQTRAFLQQHFGKAGDYYYHAARGRTRDRCSRTGHASPWARRRPSPGI